MSPSRFRAWPSSPTQSSSSRSVSGSGQTHQRQTSDSSDFGAFASASAQHPSQSAPPAPQHASLQSGDLLGSFEDLVDLGDSLPSTSTPVAGPSTSSGSHLSQRRRPPDLMSATGDEVWIELPEEHEAHAPPVREVAAPQPGSGESRRAVPQPILVPLPPRPDDISPDYVPPHTSPRRMPRRMSQNYLFPGPSSPPALSTAGAELFHPFGETDSPEGILHRQHSHSRSRTTSSDFALADEKSAHASDGPERPHSHTLLGTLATTAKVASKWKNVLAHPHDHLPQTAPLPVRSGPGTGSGASGTRTRESSGDIWGSGSLVEGRGGTALPIEVSHTTPFATPEEVAGTYVPPSGAPGFSYLHERARREGTNGDEEWERVRLMGRREGTIELRAKLPPRQRIASKWQMLFSLDQHGASLASLYRLVEKHRASVQGRAAANLLAVRDSDDNLFGVFMTDSIQKREGSYYGSGETFMWKLPSGSGGAGADDESAGLEVFKWTGRNQYFALCENTFISFGGGGNSYGLFLDSTFNKNTSATSPAFDNEVLCTAEHSHSDRAVRFDCLGLEVWAI